MFRSFRSPTNNLSRVVLPAPLLPTIPTREHKLSLQVTSFKMALSPPVYLKETLERLAIVLTLLLMPSSAPGFGKTICASFSPVTYVKKHGKQKT